MKPTVETNDPVYLLDGEIGRDVRIESMTPRQAEIAGLGLPRSTSIGVELSHEHLAQLSAGQTIRVHASPNLVIQITIGDGAVDAVRDSIAAAKVGTRYAAVDEARKEGTADREMIREAVEMSRMRDESR